MTDEPLHRLPGDRPPAEEIARMLRVDHAGEYGATRIYEGQLEVIGRGPAAGVIRQMAETEKRHLARFETLIRERRAVYWLEATSTGVVCKGWKFDKVSRRDDGLQAVLVGDEMVADNDGKNGLFFRTEGQDSSSKTNPNRNRISA